ncbi:hypothetical protein HD554DRAFT_2315755 [Boletus coccyginus]|nr:hypothetical protein HD554DRAFT_2315755 [Boletus coccyginus]
MDHINPSATSVFHPTSHSAPAKQPPSTTSISFCPASHSPESFRENDGLVVGTGEDPSLALLRAVARKQGQICDELLHSSFPPSSDALRNTIPQRNGFVHTVVEAYNRHRALIVRPDDVWIAILTQFSFFVNGNAEALRSVFVSHKGKKELVIVSGGNRYTMDPAGMASQMTKLMQEHIIDKSLREWILPNFSTTTATDNATSAIVMMGTMKEYFSHNFCLACGIPRVTLEGEKRDWEDILHRLERLKEYGIQTTAWYHLLRPILSHFVSAYDDPTSLKNLDFWNKVAHFTGGGSGPRYLSGWVTAFCMFDEQGRWQGNTFNEHTKDAKEHLHLSGPQFASAYYLRPRDAYLTLDGFPYPRIDSNDVPCGYIHVDVKLDDNGQTFDTMFVAGSIGSGISSTTKRKISRNGTRDTVRPILGWWYFTKRELSGPEQGDGTTLHPITFPGDSKEEEEVRNGRSFHRDAIARVRSSFDKLRGK